jgi:hypothetical protein
MSTDEVVGDPCPDGVELCLGLSADEMLKIFISEAD